jgi:hypothetical protein
MFSFAHSSFKSLHSKQTKVLLLIMPISTHGLTPFLLPGPRLEVQPWMNAASYVTLSTFTRTVYKFLLSWSVTHTHTHVHMNKPILVRHHISNTGSWTYVILGSSRRDTCQPVSSHHRLPVRTLPSSLRHSWMGNWAQESVSNTNKLR